ncbi:MAG: DUF4124 domain-containing protein [Cycloclasticus sp.]|nr:DUF4124 domain-containing protein [Cycloclasticus sp.]
MYRILFFSLCLIISSTSFAAIYHWVDLEGTTNYSQRPPHNKSIPSQKIIINPPAAYTQPQISIQDSANEIAKSNTARKEANDKIQQQAAGERAMRERCNTSRNNLAELDYGGNRLYKDAEGNYARLSAEDKTQQREQLQAFINENCS